MAEKIEAVERGPWGQGYTGKGVGSNVLQHSRVVVADNN